MPEFVADRGGSSWVVRAGNGAEPGLVTKLSGGDGLVLYWWGDEVGVYRSWDQVERAVDHLITTREEEV